MATYGRNNNATKATIEDSVLYASGAFKNVYKGKYIEGERAGQECVGKIFKSGSVYEDSYFEVDLKVVAKALEVINNFNRDKVINKTIWINQPSVWVFLPGYVRAGENLIVEPMIINFEKFNSNTGWTPEVSSSPWNDMLQALSHYSYHSSNGHLLFCDLQGGVYYDDGFVITDPVIMSTTGEYGPTDLGPAGLSTFFANHKCNKYCQKSWMVPVDRKQYFKIQMGSTMVLSTRRAPLTGQPPLYPSFIGKASIKEEVEWRQIKKQKILFPFKFVLQRNSFQMFAKTPFKIHISFLRICDLTWGIMVLGF